MSTVLRALLPLALLVTAAPAFAQGEAELKDFFEGKSVRVKIDMPATQQGIDVYADARRPLNFEQYAARLKSNGIAIRTGDSVLVTKVHIKDKLIEFQLAGGGYGTFGDDTSGTVSTPSAPKTNRERELERLVKDEPDAARKRRLQRELDDLRAERRREDSRNQAASAAASEAKKTRIAESRLHSGSRFNIRYSTGVPPGLGPDGVMRALSEYVEFPFATDRSDTRPRPAPVTPAPATGGVRKGMTVAEVDAVLGPPEKTTSRSEGTLKVITAIYTRDDERITAEFVEGVLIRYAIASR